MARPRAFDEGEVLGRAATVFGRHGYDGSTMTELATAMGLSAPSIYGAFGSKRGLFDAVLRRCATLQDEHWAWVLSAPTAKEVVARLLVKSQDAWNAHAANHLLLLAGFVISSENVDISTDARCRMHTSDRGLRHRFEGARLAGDLPTKVDASKLASYVTAVYDGLALKAIAGVPYSELRGAAEQAVASWSAATDAALIVYPEAKQAQHEPVHNWRRRRRFGWDAALEAAMKLFWTKGFAGTSLNDLTEAMGITRPSLYAAFGNKEELFLKALDLYQSIRAGDIRRALEAPTAHGVFEALLNLALRQQLEDGQPRGCLIVLNAMQAGEEAAVIRAEVLKRMDLGRDLLIERFGRAMEEGDLLPTVNVEGLAQFVQSLVNGIITQGATGAAEGELRALAESSLTMWTASVLPTGKDNA